MEQSPGRGSLLAGTPEPRGAIHQQQQAELDRAAGKWEAQIVVDFQQPTYRQTPPSIRSTVGG